ncbi:MAG: C40 family peptidase [Lachnospiraceae bacterium]|nr:C40 family peptidase [Lachnospiraceae bacterium]
MGKLVRGGTPGGALGGPGRQTQGSWFGKIVAAAAFAAFSLPVFAGVAYADIGPGFAQGNYVVIIEGIQAEIAAEPYGFGQAPSETLYTAGQGDEFAAVSDLGDGWIEVDLGDGYGYILLSEAAQLSMVEEDPDAQGGDGDLRQAVTQLALQFVGGRYRYGGTDPNRGVDCSGFTSYVLKNAAGVDLPHSSAAQAGAGKAISPEEIQPGDLVFYGNGRRINHVALYIGDGMVASASNERNGIIVTQWTYRTPMKIVSVLGA